MTFTIYRYSARNHTIYDDRGNRVAEGLTEGQARKFVTDRGGYVAPAWAPNPTSWR